MMTQEQSQEIWNRIKDIEVVMLTTQSDELLRARPMYQVQKQFDGTMWFLTSEESAKAAELGDNQQVCLAYADPQHGVFVSMSGSAGLVKDKALIEKFRNPAAEGWIDDRAGAQNLTLLEVHVEQAEAWDDETSAMKRLFENAKSTLTHTKPDLTEHRKYS